MSRILRRPVPALLTALLGIFALSLPALADPPARVGRLSGMSGTVSFHDSADEQWSPATLNYPVTAGNSFWTEPGAGAEIHVGSTALHLDGSTELDVRALDDQRFDAAVPQGTLNIRVLHFNDGDGYNIETPRGTVSLASPGTYRIAAGNDSEPTRVAVLEGAAQIVDPSASVSLTRGEEAVLTGTDRIDYRIVEAQPTPFDNASLASERREEAASRPATRYVSPEMTGYEDLDEHGAWQSDPTYGAVWYPQAVPADWAPYRYGHWQWIDPWGWTWIDDQPWGFAPFHYGRWAYIHDRWGWTPGTIAARPVYAPALVAFVGGGGWSASLSLGREPCVGWFPLAPREVYVPSYPASVTYVRKVNITNVTNVTTITNQTINNVNVTNVRHANQHFATVVPEHEFVAAHPVGRTALKVSDEALAKAPVATGAPLTPAVAAASGRQEAVTRATRVAQAQGEHLQGPPPQALAKPAGAEAAKPAPGPAIAAHGRAQPGQPQLGHAQRSPAGPTEAQSAQPPRGGPAPAAQAPTNPARANNPAQPSQAQAPRPQERNAPVWAQNRPAATAAPGPPIPPHAGSPSAAGQHPAAQAAAPAEAPQPHAAAPGPPIRQAARPPGAGTPPAAPSARTSVAQSPLAAPPNAPSRAAPPQAAVQPAPRAAPAPAAHAAAPPRPPAAPTVAHAAPPERSVQRPVQQTVLQPTHQGWVRQAPPQQATAPHPAPAAKPAPATKPAPAAPPAKSPPPAQQQQQHSHNGRPEPKPAAG